MTTTVLDCFTTAFPNVITIDELTEVEKLKYICGIAGEYGFDVNKEDFADNPFIATAPV